MLDLGHLPTPSLARTDIFRASNATQTAAAQTLGRWQTWAKPRGVGMVYMLAIGGGGGGGGGFTGIAGSARGGGGSGGSSSIATLLIPAICLPDLLYVQVGTGGLGVGSGGGTAGSGIVSTVAIAGSNTIVPANTVLRSGNVGAGGGGTGTAVAAGAAGAVSTVTTIALMPLGGAGVANFYVGAAGIIGGVQTGGAGGSAIIPVTGSICTSGASGAGVTAADVIGGGFTTITDSYYSGIRPIAPPAGSNNGSGGTELWTASGGPRFFFGGCGGASSNAGVGGNGGNGAIGAGGGGGGGGTTGGRGGDGGSGLVMFVSW